ncbi:MAG: hypothetical protein ACYTGX_04135 [Planctomycetota bacterium]|jgi:hypothetical protein
MNAPHEPLTPFESQLLSDLLWNCDGIDGHDASPYQFVYLWSQRPEGMSPEGFLEAMDRALERLLAKGLIAVDEGEEPLAPYSSVFSWSRLDSEFRRIGDHEDVRIIATEAGKTWSTGPKEPDPW